MLVVAVSQREISIRRHFETLQTLCVRIPPMTMSPCHTASDGVMVPLAIRRRLVDGPQLPNLCLMLLNTVVHIALIIAPSSNSAWTRTTLPFGPMKEVCCRKGRQPWLLRWLSLKASVEYKSMILHCSSGVGTTMGSVCRESSTWLMGWSSYIAFVHTRTECSAE